MATYEPIYLTSNEQEQVALGKSLETLFDYLPTNKNRQVYVRRCGNAIEIRPVEGSFKTLSLVGKDKSDEEPRPIPVSCNGKMLEVLLKSTIFHIYFSADDNPRLA